jgi:hypothetical protein
MESFRNNARGSRVWRHRRVPVFTAQSESICQRRIQSRTGSKKNHFVFDQRKRWFFLFLDFGLSRLTSLQFILYHVPGFYKPTIPQSPPSHLRDYSTCNNARLEFSTIFVPSFDPNEWFLKNGLHSGGLNPGPLGHESSA